MEGAPQIVLLLRTRCTSLRGRGDGTVDLTDAAWTLRFLFAGEGSLSCSDSADANDDGAVNIADALATLGHLFVGGVEIPSPGPTRCGHDPTPDDLECTSYLTCP